MPDSKSDFGLLRIGLPLAAALLFLSCSHPAREQNSTPNEAATARQTATPKPRATPPPVPLNAAKEMGAGSFEQFKFSYVKTGEQVVADFKPLKLPHTNQNIVIAAARNVIHLVYGEEMKNFPRLVGWHYKEMKNGIKLEGDKYDYIFVPIKDAEKDISQMIFWRVEKGAVDE